MARGIFGRRAGAAAAYQPMGRKRDAVDAFEKYLDILRDAKAGRI